LAEGDDSLPVVAPPPLKDAEFIGEAKKGNFELDPVAGEELERIVNGLFKADPAIVNKLRELLK